MKYKQNTQNLKKIKDFGKNTVAHVGIVETQTHSSGIDMAYLQTIQQYGSITQNIPARDVYNEPTQRNAKTIDKRIASALKSNFTEFDETNFFEIYGEAVLQEAVLHTFRTGEGLALNAPRTIAKKGSASPLIDTGELMKAQKVKVVKK